MAMRSPVLTECRCDLAELYIKLKHYDRAERTLNVGLDHGDGKYIVIN